MHVSDPQALGTRTIRRILMSAKLLIVAAAFLSAGALGAQAPVTGIFISKLGEDTVAIERYTRTGTRLEGEVVSRFPRVRAVRYVADLDGGKFRGISVTTRGVSDPAAAPAMFSMITLLGDSVATIEIQRGGLPDTVNSVKRSFRGRVAPSVPGFPAAVGLYEQILAFNPPSGRDSVRVATLGAGNPSTLSLLRRSRDTVVLVSSLNNGWVEVATVDANGRITSLDARATTVKTVTQRATGADFDAITKDWAAIEAARGRAGSLSPADSVHSTIGAANIEIHYSRPAKRGRQVWGNLVKWGVPWRTGANAATQFTTSADLLIGETTVPAGKYTLWTLPTPTGTQLIINTQTGQWGTVYDPARDLVRVPMTQATLPRPVEQFTITVAPAAPGGVLRMSWDDREYSVPFRVK
jgi:hypothetical protein